MQQLNLKGRGRLLLLLRGACWDAANPRRGPRLLKVAHALMRGASGRSGGGRQLLQGQHLWAFQHGSQVRSAVRVRVRHGGPRGHGQLRADRRRHLILSIGGRVGVSGSFRPRFVPHRRGNAAVGEIAHHARILHAHARSFRVVHPRPHVGWSHSRRSQTWKVVLRRPVAHVVHVQALGMVVVGGVHAGFRRGPRLQGYGTRTQRRPVSWTHVGRLLLLLLVLRLWVVGIVSHRVARTNVASFNHAMLAGGEKVISVHHELLLSIIGCKR